MSPFRRCCRIQLAFALAATMLMANACTQAPSGNGTLKGTFISEGGALGPDGAQPSPHPLDGVITATRGTTVVASARAIDGSFTLTLPPGTYTITGIAGAEHGTACTVTSKVTSGATSSVEVICYNA